jgi:uncharacterized coiled-coil protein SlyX
MFVTLQNKTVKDLQMVDNKLTKKIEYLTKEFENSSTNSFN